MKHYRREIPASMLERKQLHASLELKNVAEDGTFAGYASVFDVVDQQKDVVLRGAFTHTIAQRKHEIKLLWQHQPDEPIGVIEQIFEDARGLYMQGKLLVGITKAREALLLLKAGAVTGLSIGYSPVRYKIDPETGVRKIAEVKLWEISLVTFPANPQAQVTVVKHAASAAKRNVAMQHECLELPGNQMAWIQFSDAVDRALSVLRNP